ncbi:MAG: hypothetical protein ACFFDN_01945 [Candidatus Hodarchaeota archaeon]
MEPKNLLFFICGIALCGLGLLLLILGYQSYKKQALSFDIITIILFIQLAPEFSLDFSYDFYDVFSVLYLYYLELILELIFTIYVILFDFIQSIIQPFIITFFFPFTGLISISIGAIFFVLIAISYRRQYSNIEFVNQS